VADPVFEEAEGPDVHVAVRYRPQKAQQTRSGGDLKRKSLTLEKVFFLSDNNYGCKLASTYERHSFVVFQ
jgi:hypothetical protein